MLRTKLALLAATALVSGVLAVPAFTSSAMADVNVTVTVDKDKLTLVSVSVDITKDIEIDVTLNATAEGHAEANAEVNANSSNNTTILHLFDGEGDTNFTHRLATITDSINGNLGVILQVNQDVGENANQGNLAAISFSDVQDDPSTPGVVEAAVTHSEAAVSQVSSNNNIEFFGSFPGFVTPDNGLLDDEDFHVRAEITNSVNANNGVVFVNQNAGQNTNQHNVLALSVGLDSAVALAEGDLGQESSNNDRIFDVASFKRDLIEGSVNGNTGIVGVNQSVGHNNNQATVISIAATSAASNLVPGSGNP